MHILFRAAILILILPTPALAYFDTYTFSMVLQAMEASLAGGAVVLKLYWDKIVGFFRRFKGPVTKDSVKK